MAKDIQAQIKKLQDEEKATQALLNDYPSKIRQPDLIVWQNSSLSEFSLIFKVKTLSEVVNLVKSWHKYILPLKFERGTSASFRTSKHKEDKNIKTSVNVFPITVKVSHWGIKFEFYAMINNHLVGIDIEFEYGIGFQQWASVRQFVERDSRGDIIARKTSFNAPAFHVDQRVQWASGSNDYPGDTTLYWTKGNIKKFTDIFQPEFLNS